MIQRISLVLALAAASAITSCKDKNPSKTHCETTPSDCKTVLAAKEFFLFKEGSWWVYEEATSLERDSMYVTAYTNTNTYDFSMRIKSALTNYEYHYWPYYTSGNPLCSATELVQGKCILVKVSKEKPGDFVGEGNCFFVNFKEGVYEASASAAFPNNKITVAQIFSSYELNGMSFNETVKINELHTLIEGQQPTNQFYARGVGLIRRELLDSNEVWNLVSYHIEE